jgi:hypothetical protein
MFMKLKLIHIAILIGLMITTFSCDGCNEGPPCQKKWQVYIVENSPLIAEIDTVNTQMSLQIASMNPHITEDFQGEVFQEYFTGDYNVVAPFSNFVSGPLLPFDGNPYAEIIMYNSEVPDTVLDTMYVRAGISRDFIYAAIGISMVKKQRLSHTNSGKFRIQKIGNSLLGQTIEGTDTVTKTLSMPFVPVRFAVRMGSFGDSVISNTTAIKIDAFNVSGTSGSSLLSDEFKCNSIVF